MVQELLQLGMDHARSVHAHIPPNPADPANPDPAAAKQAVTLAITHDRIARGIRRGIALIRRLHEPLPPLPAERLAAARRRIIREVEDVIQRRPSQPGEQDDLQAELAERLDSPDLDDDIDHRPIPDIIADICRDLGIAGGPGTHPWKRRTPADIADLCARAARAPAPDPADPAQGRPEQPERAFHLVAAPDRNH